MMNIRALRTSLSMRVKARNVTARRPVMVPKNARKPTTTQRSAMAGRTLGFGLPVSGRYIYRFECSLLSLTSGQAHGAASGRQVLVFSRLEPAGAAEGRSG